MKRLNKLQIIAPLLLWASLLLSGCAYMFNSIVVPNRCMRCEVKSGTTVYWSDEDCGGGTAGMEDDCKIEAYDRIQSTKDAYIECECTTYKNESE